MIPIAGSALHLRLRHAGRAHRLDHRLGPDPRVSLRRVDRRGRLVGLRGLVPQGPRHQHPAAVHLRAVHPHRRRPTPASTCGGCSPRAGPARAAVLNLPAMIIVALDHHPADHRHHGVGQLQQRRSSSSRSTVVLLFIGFGMALHQPRELGARSSRRRPGPGKYGWSGVVRGAGVIFFAYIGFDAVSHRGAGGQESAARHADRHPRLARHLHRALHRRWRSC